MPVTDPDNQNKNQSGDNDIKSLKDPSDTLPLKEQLTKNNDSSEDEGKKTFLEGVQNNSDTE